MGISLGAWMAAPILTFFWIYKGWSFGKSLLITLVIDGVYYSFRLGGLFFGITVLLSTLAAFWVYGDTKTLKVKFGIIFVILTFLFLPIGLLSYLLLRKFLSKIKVEEIKTEESVIKIHS